MSGTTEMTQYSQDMTSQLSLRQPEDVLEEARRAAVALKGVIDLKKNKVVFNGETYLEFEDWQTVGRFYGCTVKVERTEFVQFGDVRGFECTAVVLDRNQNIISQAESLCLSDEENWGMVSEYEWKDKLDDEGKKIWDPNLRNNRGGYVREKVLVGEKPKPLFQLKSMAQTRACARALRQVFAWVVVLAGYQPSVAEEMTGNEQPRNDADPQDRKPPVQRPGRASEAVIEEVSGAISNAKLSAKTGSLWCHVSGRLLAISKDRVTGMMENGNYLSVKAKRATLNDEAKTEYWGVVEVLKCEAVQSGDDYGFSQGAAEDGTSSQEVPTANPIDDVFKETGMKTGREVQQETDAKKERAWRSHVGHDPEVHISYKQGMLLFAVANACKLSDEVVKGILLADFEVEHRYLIRKEDFEDVLDKLDPAGKHHDRG